MQVVLLGGAGYIGAVVCDELARQGHDVVVLDNLIYRPDGRPPTDLPGTFRKGDSRDETLLRSTLEGADAVIHLGGLVSERACAIDEGLSVELNYASPVLAGEVAAELGVPLFVFLSTCSVYGRQDGLVTEETVPNPLSCYALTKQRAETRLAELLAGRVRFVVLRLATVFGLSPRMRFDSVVNLMAARAVHTGEIPLRIGRVWRPLVHVRDVAESIRRIIDEQTGSRYYEPLILNVGHSANNYAIADIAAMVTSSVPGTVIRAEERATDHRDYRVSFERIAGLLPGACQTPVTIGIEEIVAAMRAGQFPDPAAVEFDNLRGLEAALAAGRVAAVHEGPMRRLRKEYDGAGAGAYDEQAAARYWGGERLSGVAHGDASAEDAAVLCKGKPPWVSAAYAQWELDCLNAMLPSITGKSLVDLGCGVGRLLAQVAGRCRRAVGVDAAPEMVARARRRLAAFPHAEILVGSIADIPLPANSAEVVLCLGVFEHVPALYRGRALAEIARVLVPGGQAVLELNNANSVLLADLADDNPYRLGQQLGNGYYCELVAPDVVLAAAEEVGLALAQRMANPFYSAVRHGQDGESAEAAALFEHARHLDRALGASPQLWQMADQHMVRVIKQ